MALNFSWKFAVELTTMKVFPLKDFTMYSTSHQQIVVLHRLPTSTLHSCISDRVRLTEWDIGEAQFLIYFLKPPEASTYWAIDGAQPSLSNMPANTKATKSLNGAQLSITNLPANTETMSNTQHRNSVSVTSKENISNKSGHSTSTHRNYLNTPIIT